MSYVSSNLSSGEHVVYEAKISWLCLLNNILIGIFLVGIGIFISVYDLKEKIQLLEYVSVGSIVVGFGFIAYVALFIHTTEIVLTNKRVIAKFGFISRDTIEMRLNKIEVINVKQSLLDRILNIGTIVIIGSGGSEQCIPYIADPITFRNNVNATMDN